MTERPGAGSTPEPVRVDKWLWAARFFKTRALAAEAIDGGKVEINGHKPKPARPVHMGDEVRLRLGPYEYLLSVRGLSGRRGPASEAVKLKIKQIIGSESPQNPHSDQRIVELLKDQNIEIARRTVAKYREQLRILSSSKRRQVF